MQLIFNLKLNCILMTKIFDYICTLSDLKILCFFITFIPFFAYLLYGSLKKLFWNKEILVDKDLGRSLLSSSFAITTFLLTFTLIQTLSTYQKINSSVYDEISIMEQIDITLVGYDTKKTDAFRTQLEKYIQSIINQEWGGMSDDSEQIKPSKEFHDLYNMISKASNSTDDQLKDLSQKCFPLILDLSKVRYLRQQFAGMSLPKIFWIGIFFLILTSVTLFFLLDKKNPYYSLILLFPMISIGVLMALVVIFDKPFSGEKSVTAKAFQLFIDRMHERSYLNNK